MKITKYPNEKILWLTKTISLPRIDLCFCCLLPWKTTLQPFRLPTHYFRESSIITDYHFTAIGLYLSEEVFSHESLVDKFAFGGKIGKPGLEPETHLRFVCWLAPAALPVKLHTHNRPLTVSTRIYRAMRDTIWFLFTTIRQNTRWLFLTWSLHAGICFTSSLTA